MNPHITSILEELGFFLALVCLSECTRRLVKRAKPDSRAAAALLISSLVLGVCIFGALPLSELLTGWYCVSITLVLLNKWVMKSWRGGLDFPLFYTMSHMVLKGCFSLLYLALSCHPPGKQRRSVCCGVSFVGVMTALDVAASNMSFLFITVAFYTMLKSASLIFILVLGAVLRIEKCSAGIAATVVLISIGIFITSYGETDFDLRGFWLVLGSEVFAALRWLATQKTLQSSGLTAMQTVFYMSPASSLTLAPFVWAREKEKLHVLAEPNAAGQYLLLVLLPGFLAFLLLLVEVQLVKATSSLTLAVFGNLKSIVTILFSIFVFGEKTTALQWSGLLLALAGMLIYARLKNKSVAVDSLASLRYEVLPQDADEDTLPDPADQSPSQQTQKEEEDDEEECSGDAAPASAPAKPASSGPTPTVLGVASDQSGRGLEDFASFDEVPVADTDMETTRNG
ncbi:SLC35C2 [Symbiodinium natans]|uniref:SLC35C2 protein n=1 Tax=Symbiodinium natans TaxID=878477 RepID=A0A812UF20_9DINO|nr:SLC35C2 [Symbiodinium natans]